MVYNFSLINSIAMSSCTFKYFQIPASFLYCSGNGIAVTKGMPIFNFDTYCQIAFQKVCTNVIALAGKQ